MVPDPVISQPVDQVTVATAATDHRVVAGSTAESVIARPALEAITPRSSEQPVVPRPAIQPVVSRTADELVVVSGAQKNVPTVASHDDVRSIASGDRLARRSADLNQHASIDVSRPPICERQGPRAIRPLVDHREFMCPSRIQNEPCTSAHQPPDALNRARSGQEARCAVSIESDEHPLRPTLGRDDQEGGRGPWVATKQHVSLPKSLQINLRRRVDQSLSGIPKTEERIRQRRRIVGGIPGGVDLQRRQGCGPGNRVQLRLVLVERMESRDRARQIQRPRRKKDRRHHIQEPPDRPLLSDLDHLADLRLQRPDGIPCIDNVQDVG